VIHCAAVCRHDNSYQNLAKSCHESASLFVPAKGHRNLSINDALESEKLCPLDRIENCRIIFSITKCDPPAQNQLEVALLITE
jgi:hypothetical protein